MAAAPTFDPQRPIEPTALGKWASYAREFLLAAGRDGGSPVLLDAVQSQPGEKFLPAAWFAQLEPLLFGGQKAIEIRAGAQSDAAPSLEDILGALDEDDAETIATNPKQAQAHRVLAELHTTAAARPHETGFSYGAVFIEGHDSSGRPVHAPLYTVPVDVTRTADAHMRIAAAGPTAQLQLGLLAHIMPDAYPLMAGDLHPLAELPLPMDRDAVHQLIEVLRTFSNHIDVPRELLGQFARWDMIEEPSSAPRPIRTGHYRLTRVAGLSLVARDGRVLPRELQSLAQRAEQLENSVAHRLAQAHSASNPFLVETRFPSIATVTPANHEQLDILRAVGENDLLHVQGPPGTGKSQTIANIAAQWVLEGRKVLVVCPNRGILCGLAERNFQPLGMPFLPAAVSQAGGRVVASSAELRRQLDAALGSAKQKVTAAELARHGEELARRAAEADAQIATVLGQHAEPWKDTSLTRTELAQEYEQNDHLDALPEGPPVTWAEHPALADDLVRAVDLADAARGKGKDPAEILGLRRATGGTGLQADLARLGDVLSTGAGPVPAGSGEQPPSLDHLSDRTPEDIDKMRDFLGKQLQRLDNLYAEPLCRETLARTQGKPADICEEDLRALRNFRRALPELRRIEERAAACPAEGVSPLELTQALASVEKQREGQDVPQSELATAKEILTRAVGGREAAKNLNLSSVKARVQASRLRVALGESRHKRLAELPVPEVPRPLDAAGERELTAACLSIDHALEERIASARAVSAANDWIDVELLLEPERCAGVDRGLAEIQSSHKSEASLAEARKLTRDLQLAERPGMMRELAVAVEQGDRDLATSVFAKLTESWRDDSDIAEISKLLESSLRNHRDWLAALLEASASPAEVRAQVRARAVRTELAESFSAPEPDVETPSAKARQLEAQARQTARYQLEAALNERATEHLANTDTRHYLKRFSEAATGWRATLETAATAGDATEAFGALLGVLPCWLATPEDIAGAFPLDPNLFDLVLVDDASLLNPARGLPALARAPRAAVFGDEQQIGPAECRAVSTDDNEALLQRAGLGESDFADCGVRSLFDLTRSRASATLRLTQHFRCQPDIAAFANERFYSSQWSVLSGGEGTWLTPPRKLVLVEGAEDDIDAQVNHREAEAVVHAIQKLAAHPKYEGLRIGICSLFETQAEEIRDKLEQGIAPRVREQMRLRCGTPRDWLGDECDVMLLSFRFAENSPPRILDGFDGLDGSRVMSVVATRARAQLVCFASCSPRRFPRGVIREFLEDVEEQREASFDHKDAPSPFEKALGEYLADKGLRVDYRVLLGDITVDLVVRSPDGYVVAIDADGDRTDESPDADEVACHRELQAAGWNFQRVYAPTFYVEPDAAVQHLWPHLRQS